MIRTGYGVSAEEVTVALYSRGPGEHLASSLNLNASIQSISNALRWAEINGYVDRPNRKGGASLWRVKASVARMKKFEL